MSNIILECQNLTRSFVDGKRSIQVLDNISFAVQAGESIAITGASGAGKSSLLHLLGGLDRPTSGSVHLMGQDLSSVGESKKKQIAQ